MKKVISIALVALMVVSMFAGCSLFSDNTLVKFDDTHTHNDPADLTYDDRVVLRNTKFDEYLESIVNSAAYPDTMVYDTDGNMVGMYNYDETTGLATGWTDLSTGEYNEFDPDKMIDLGKPDASLMIDLPEGIVMGAVVYGNESKAVSAYLYIFLPDAAVSQQVSTIMEENFGMKFESKDDTTLTFVKDADAINSEFDAAIEAGMTVMTKDASAYGELLSGDFSLMVYKGENAYKPYTDYEDPTDLDYDEKVVLVGSGEYAIVEEYVEYLTSMTDVLYGKDGKMVGHYTYYVATSKEGADAMYGWIDSGDSTVSRVSDTVICEVKTGDILAATLTQYQGYNVLADDSVADYTRMIEETFFSVVCE